MQSPSAAAGAATAAAASPGLEHAVATETALAASRKVHAAAEAGIRSRGRVTYFVALRWAIGFMCMWNVIKEEEEEPLKPNTAHDRHSKVLELCVFATWDWYAN